MVIEDYSIYSIMITSNLADLAMTSPQFQLANQQVIYKSTNDTASNSGLSTRLENHGKSQPLGNGSYHDTVNRIILNNHQ
jgi:hypothetical protein